VSRLRWALVALLVLSTALFAVGAIAERSDSDQHTEPASAQVGETGEEPGGASGHEDGEEAGADEDEALLGVDLESTPLIVLAVIGGFALAALAASPLGRLPGFLLAVVAVAALWAALDIREVVHQLDESHTGIAAIAVAVAALHLAAAAVSGRLAAAARQAEHGSPGRPGTMPA
jgi:hypothetical protein